MTGFRVQRGPEYFPGPNLDPVDTLVPDTRTRLYPRPRCTRNTYPADPGPDKMRPVYRNVWLVGFCGNLAPKTLNPPALLKSHVVHMLQSASEVQSLLVTIFRWGAKPRALPPRPIIDGPWTV